jgi:uncharacterized membrane-anchored protein YitT (DUF2179 family)
MKGEGWYSRKGGIQVGMMLLYFAFIHVILEFKSRVQGTKGVVE